MCCLQQMHWTHHGTPPLIRQSRNCCKRISQKGTRRKPTGSAVASAARCSALMTEDSKLLIGRGAYPTKMETLRKPTTNPSRTEAGVMHPMVLFPQQVHWTRHGMPSLTHQPRNCQTAASASLSEKHDEIPQEVLPSSAARCSALISEHSELLLGRGAYMICQVSKVVPYTSMGGSALSRSACHQYHLVLTRNVCSRAGRYAHSQVKHAFATGHFHIWQRKGCVPGQLHHRISAKKNLEKFLLEIPHSLQTASPWQATLKSSPGMKDAFLNALAVTPQ